MEPPSPSGLDVDSAAPPSAPVGAVHLLRSLNRLRRAGGALLTQAELHGQLARIEWAEEKRRLVLLLFTLLFGVASAICLMLFAGGVVVALSWQTDFRTVAIVAVLAAYSVACLFAWRRLLSLSARGNESFAATREELAADLAMLKSQL